VSGRVGGNTPMIAAGDGTGENGPP
jgi:hypothetical protein